MLCISDVKWWRSGCEARLGGAKRNRGRTNSEPRNVATHRRQEVGDAQNTIINSWVLNYNSLYLSHLKL